MTKFLGIFTRPVREIENHQHPSTNLPRRRGIIWRPGPSRMILERHGKGRNPRVSNLVQLQDQSIKVVGVQKILEIIIAVKAKIITGDPQQPQETENLGTPIQMAIMHQVLILLVIRNLERSISMIHHPTGQIDFISVDIQHQDLAITAMVMVAITAIVMVAITAVVMVAMVAITAMVMVAREETMTGGRKILFKEVNVGLLSRRLGRRVQLLVWKFVCPLCEKIIYRYVLKLRWLGGLWKWNIAKAALAAASFNDIDTSCTPRTQSRALLAYT